MEAAMDTTRQNPTSDAIESGSQTGIHRTEDGYTTEHVNGVTVTRYEPNYQPADVPSGMSLQLALRKYEIFKNSWKVSEYHARLVEFFKNTILKVKNQQITSCLAVGLGTFTGSNPYGSPDPQSSLYQLAVFETVVELLRRKFPGLKAAIQDPVMNSLDEELVRCKEFTVLDHPGAVNLMTPTSFLFIPRVPWTVIQELLEVASPALYLGDRLDDYLDQVTYGIDCCENAGHTGRITKTWNQAITGAGITICDESAKRLMEGAKADEKRFNTVFKPYTDGKFSSDLAIPYNGEVTMTLTLYWAKQKGRWALAKRLARLFIKAR